MSELSAVHLLAERAALRELVAQLRADLDAARTQIAHLQADNDRLRAENAALRADLDATRRAGKRQAAPFATGTPKPDPKNPGRTPGDDHGRHAHRAVPDHVDDVLDAPLPPACPGCGSPVAETHVDHQFQTDIPRRPIVRRFDVHCGWCTGCGASCRGRHPRQTSDATGAAASQLGPDAQAAIVWLNKDAGLSHGKVARAFDALFGLRLSRGASAQVVLRAGRRLKPAYDEIKARLKASEHITPDETGWRIGGHSAWLHAWVGDGVTCYAVHPNRGADALAEVIGIDWSGVMTHDGFSADDRFGAAIHQQCVAHALRRAHTLERTQPGPESAFPRQVITLFQDGLAVRDAFLAGTSGDAALAAAHERCAGSLLDLTEPRPAGEANARFAKHLWNHAEQWFMVLIDPHTPATNWEAEQAVRPAVVNRKVWGGNRTAAGAEAQGVISSVLATCRQQAVSAFEYVRDTLCGIARVLLPPVTATGR